jgi:hypothetical protein
MTILKIKAFIYQRTGIYLANKEELEYVTSKEFWKHFKKIVLHKKNDLNMETVQGLLIGLWQSKHGFYRTWKQITKKGKRRK